MECLGKFVGKPNPCLGHATPASCQLLVLLIETIISYKCNISSNADYPKSYTNYLKNGDSFDFIVVGGGTAGSIVASRLSEIPEWKVLLLEAGDYPTISSEIPWLHPSLVESAEDWNFTTEKTPEIGGGLKGGVIKIPKGKVLGGSSAINHLVYMRGNKKDYDTWSGMGNQEWCFDCVKKIFEKIEKVKDPLDASTTYGRKGKLQLTQTAEKEAVYHAIKSAILSQDILYSDDEVPTGYFQSFSNTKKGTRESSSKAYLTDGIERPNLFIAKQADVTKIIIDPADKRLRGVEIRVNKTKTLKILSQKEVIISAGAINSPKLLTCSGIGIRGQVSQAKAALIKELKVGENLQDHVAYPGFFVKLKDCVYTQHSEQVSDDFYNFIVHRKGGMTNGGMNFIGLINTKNLTAVQSNVQFYHRLFTKNDPYLMTFLRRFSMETYLTDAVEQANKNHALLMVIPVLIASKSTGSVVLRGCDPLVKPKIFPPYYRDSSDVDVMTDAVTYLEKLFTDAQVAKFVDGYVALPIKKCQDKKKMKNLYTKCALQELASSMSNPVGTCKMGPEFDQSSVVDPQLQVYGIKGLRVVDACIMPKIVSGDVMGATMMIAEKGAKTIKEAHMGCPHVEL